MGVLSTPGAGVRARESCDSRALPHDRRLEYPSFRRLKLTKPRRGFTRVHPSTLSLTRFDLMGRSLLRHFPWLRTPPLPTTHAGAGTGIGHSPECSFPSYTTLTVRLRVAHNFAYSRPRCAPDRSRAGAGRGEGAVLCAHSPVSRRRRGGWLQVYHPGRGRPAGRARPSARCAARTARRGRAAARRRPSAGTSAPDRQSGARADGRRRGHRHRGGQRACARTGSAVAWSGAGRGGSAPSAACRQPPDGGLAPRATRVQPALLPPPERGAW